MVIIENNNGTLAVGWGRSRPGPSSLYQNVSAHPSTANAIITVLLYNGSLLCGVYVPTKGLKEA